MPQSTTIDSPAPSSSCQATTMEPQQSPPILGDDLPLPPHRLFERLSQISGHSWDQSAEIVHSSYDHWHVTGLRCVPEVESALIPTPVASSRSKDSSNPSNHTSPGTEHRAFFRPHARPSLSESSSDVSSSVRQELDNGVVPVIARVSTHVIRLEREFHMLKSIIETSDPECEHTVRPIDLLRLTPQPGDAGPLLVTLYEDPGPNYLKKLVSFGPAFFQTDVSNDHIQQGPVEVVSLSTFLDFAIGACECLELLHYGLKTIHGEIRPDAFHFNHETGSVKLSNTGNGARSFDNALSDGWSALSRELGAKHKLQYIAPEQTGRLPTEPDSRTDIYALGVLFWAMLMGRPAFDGNDPVEVVQNVLNKKLSPVSSQRMDIPNAASAVIQKMTQKSIDERYHTISAVKWDLQQIASLLGNGDADALKNFTIAQRDISSFFTLPTGLFGRKEEYNRILSVIHSLQKRQRVAKAKAGVKGTTLHPFYASSGSSLSGDRFDAVEIGSASSDSGSLGAVKHPSVSGGSGPAAAHASTHESLDSAASATNKNIPLVTRLKSPADSRLSWDTADRDGHLSSSLSGSQTQFDGMAPIGRRKVQAKYRDVGRCEVIAISGAGGLGKSDLIQRVQPEIRKQGYLGVARLDRSRRVPFEPFRKILAGFLRQMFSEGDVTTEYHDSIRTILQPIWSSLHRHLGLPEQLLYSLASSTGQTPRKPRKSAPLQVVQEGVETSPLASESEFVSLSRADTSSSSWRAVSDGVGLKFAEIFVDVLKIMSLYKLTCLCLEDVQYADRESAQLLAHLSKAKVRCLLMVTSRLDEVASPDLKSIFQSDAPNVMSLELQPLSEDDILEYVAATMHQQPNKSLVPLAAVVAEKSQGIPFYIRMMLETCYRKNCIWYCWKDSRWQYDLDRIFSEFVVPNYGEGLGMEFITRRFQEIPSEARSILLWASLLGSPFSFSLVRKLLSGEFLYTIDGEDENDITCPRRILLKQSDSDVVWGLQYLLQSYIILPGDTDDEFRFAFDRYAQAVASMRECGNKKKMHFIIAQTMMKYLPPNEKLYSKAHHICMAAELIKDRVPNRIRYRDVLYQAAVTASKSGAKSTALVYLQTCLYLLQEDAWEHDVADVFYEETRELHLQTAQMLFSQGQSSAALDLLDVMFANAHTAACKASAWILKSRIHAADGDITAALGALLTSIGELGVNIDTSSTWEACNEEYLKLSSYLYATDLDALFVRPLSEDRDLTAVAAVLSEAIGLCVWGEPLMFFRLTIEAMKLYTYRGAFSQISYLCTHMAMIAISRFKDMTLGLRFSDAALAFLGAHKEAAVLARGVTIHNYFINHMRVPIAAMLPVLESSMEAADMLGERHLILVNISAMVFARFFLGHDLGEVEALCNYGPGEIHDWESDLRGGVGIVAVRQAARALQGKTYINLEGRVMSDEKHDEQQYIDHIINRGANFHSLNTYHSTMLVPLFLYGYYERVVSIGTKMTETLHGMWSLRTATMTHFYLSLALLTIQLDNPAQTYDQAVIEQVMKYKEEIDFKREACEANYGMWSLILEALLCEINGDFAGTNKAFEAALDHTQLYSWPLEEALAYELQVEFFIRRGAKRAAQSLLHRSIGAWNSIGAVGKARHLSDKHEWLLRMGAGPQTSDVGCQTVDSLLHVPSGLVQGGERESPNNDAQFVEERKQKWLEQGQQQDRDNDSLDISGVGLDIIDLSSILDFSHVISKELQIDKLLTKMVEIILETCSGSECALVITESESHGWCVAAAGDTENGKVAYVDGLPLSEVEEKMAQQITHFTLRTREPVLVHNVLEDERFVNVNEAYAANYPHGRSVIALPITQANNLLGVIHIEGKPNSFTNRNMVVLRLICNQLGISLANAFLFQEAKRVSAANAAMVEAQKRALTHAREAEQKAKIAEAEAKHNVKLKEDAAKAKSIFLANISHDLRTPMNGVIGLSEMLKETKLDAQQDSYVESIRVCADTLLTLINDILDFSKLEAGKMKVSVVPLNLRETIAEVVRALRYTHRDRGLETIEDLDAVDPDLLVMGDPVRLHQIFMNLLSNSYKFTPKGSVAVRAKVDKEDAEKIRVTCTVSDTGIGISKEQLSRLFRPFSQADSSTARSYGGSGLGLSICKAIIEDVLGGKIWLDSQEGVGTTVTFTLTFKKAPKDGVAQPSWSHPHETNNHKALLQRPVRDLTSIPRDQIRVCIAEDNPINQKIAVTFVENLGLTSEVFSDGEQAVEALRQRSKEGNPFHVVLMDVQMPVLDGYNATRKIRADGDPNVNEVLVIAMTASAIEGDREKCIEAGMNNYLAKPVRSDVLRSMLDRYLAPQTKKTEKKPRKNTGLAFGGMDGVGVAGAAGGEILPSSSSRASTAAERSAVAESAHAGERDESTCGATTSESMRGLPKSNGVSSSTPAHRATTIRTTTNDDETRTATRKPPDGGGAVDDKDGRDEGGPSSRSTQH
ncbi:hypothetical protein VTO42DRAFT_5889 [Malbranchea cinnamomea]